MNIVRLIYFFIIANSLNAQSHEECGTFKVNQSFPTDVLSSRTECNENEFLVETNIVDGNPEYECVEFELVKSDETTNIYVESGEYSNGNISYSAIETIYIMFTQSTPNAQVGFQNGIKNAEETIFGVAPPNIDGSGKVNILLLDIQDNYSGSGNFVAGYFDANDQLGNGNTVDVIYIDSNPGNLTSSNPERALFTLAHEYQHLLHWSIDKCEGYFNYTDTSIISQVENAFNCTPHNPWLNEGLSDLMPSILGIDERDYSYFLENTTIGLDEWVPFGSNSAPYYAKSALFMQFLYEYFDYEFAAFDSGQDAINVIFNDNDEQGIASLVDIIGREEFDDLFKIWIESIAIAELPSGTTIDTPALQLTLSNMQLESEEEISFNNYYLPAYSSVHIEIPTDLLVYELVNLNSNADGILVSNFETILNNNDINYWNTDSTYYQNLILSLYTSTSSTNNVSIFIHSNDLEESIEKYITTYPNPVDNSKLKFDYISSYTDLANQLNVKIFNLLGQKVHETSIPLANIEQTGEIELINLTNGMYFLVLSDNTFIEKSTITIIK